MVALLASCLPARAEPTMPPGFVDAAAIVPGLRTALLAQAMMRRGFLGYDKEWWHFTSKDEPYPMTTFDVPIR